MRFQGPLGGATEGNAARGQHLRVGVPVDLHVVRQGHGGGDGPSPRSPLSFDRKLRELVRSSDHPMPIAMANARTTIKNKGGKARLPTFDSILGIRVFSTRAISRVFRSTSHQPFHSRPHPIPHQHPGSRGP